MRIDNIMMSNVDMLYSATVPRGNDDKFGRTRIFTKNIESVYNKAFITFELSEVTLLEVFLMKRFASSVMISEGSEFNDYDSEELRSVIQNLITMENDEDITIKPDTLLLSSDIVEKRVVATFSGLNLSSIITSFPHRFFAPIIIEAKNDPSITMDNLPIELPTDDITAEKIKDGLIESFLVNFYQYCSDEYDKIDICSDAVNRTMYHDMVTKKECVQIVEISSPTGMVNFTDKDSFSMESLKNAQRIKELKKGFIVSEDQLMKNIYVTISVVSSLNTFLYLSFGLPNHIINDYTNLKLLLNPDHVDFPGEWEPYKTRITTKYDYMESRLKSDANSKKVDLKTYLSIPLYRPIYYTLRLSLYDINYELNDFCNGIYKSINNKCYVKKELENIVNQIIMAGKIAMKYLF